VQSETAAALSYSDLIVLSIQMQFESFS